MRTIYSGLMFLILFTACYAAPAPQTAHATTAAKRPTEYTFTIVHSYPHDQNAFTQGLVYHNGFLYEGTGLNGHSSLRKVNLETGQVLQKIDLPQEYFGEGIAIVKDQVFELTWQSEVAFVYNLNDFRAIRQYSYAGEGWGLTNNGNDLYMSDGSSEIRVIDSSNFKEKRRIKVHDGSKPIDQLNELEYIDGELFANIWQTDRIARISPQTGEVVGWIDLSGLLSAIYQRPKDAVLNGIAYDSEHKRLFVTGKLWPTLYEIKLVPKSRK
jgi:glutaminyl-peptide cyclotransferase